MTYVIVSMIVGFVAVITVVIGMTLWLRGELRSLGADVKSDISGLKSSIRSIDESQRRMENDLAFIKGALLVAIPGLREGASMDCKDGETG